MKILKLISINSTKNSYRKHFEKRFLQRVGRLCREKELESLKKQCRIGELKFLGYSKNNSSRTIFGKNIDRVWYRIVYDSKTKELVTIL